MTTKTVKTTSPTKIMLDRLAESSIRFGHHGNEIQPWLDAAAVAGCELPPAILTVAEAGLHLATQRAALVRPQAHKPTDVHALIGGRSPAEVLKLDDEHAAAVARWERETQMVTQAEQAWEGDERDAFDLVRDELIRHQLRHAVQAVLNEARDAGRKLLQYAPDIESGLLRRGTQAEIETWRQTRQLQRDLAVFQAAWLASSRREYVHRVPRRPLGIEYRPLRPAGWYAWADPNAVTDEALRLGHDCEILRIAGAASEYRLVSPSELVQVIADLDQKVTREGPNGSAQVRRDVCV